MSSKKEKAQRIAHMTRYLPKKMGDVRKEKLNETQLQMLKQELFNERTYLEKCVEDICTYLNRENCIKDVEVPSVETRKQAANFSYINGLEAYDFMFVEEFYMYSKYKQQRPELLKDKLNIGIGLLYACIYDLINAIAEVQCNIEYMQNS